MDPNDSKDRLENLTQEQLVALLRSTYEYKSFTDYHDQHHLTFLHKTTPPRDSPSTNDCSERTILKELEQLNESEGLGLHKYHQDLILNTFKNYYWDHQQEQVQALTHKYQALISKAQKQMEHSFPRELEDVCLQKERELARQVQKKRTKTVKM